MPEKGNGSENHTFNKPQKSNPCCIKHWADLSETLHLPASTTACFFHMYAIRSWFFVRFVTTHTETKTKWQRHSAVRKVKWKAKLLKHSNSDPDAVHNNAHPALGSQTRVDPSSTSTTCNPIYIAGTILELQITMEFCRPQMHETKVTPHLQCGTDPNMIREWSDHTRDRLAPVAPHR